MKRVFVIVSIIACSLSGYAQQSEVNPNGYNRFYYPEGGISSEGTLRNGQPDGYWKTYFPNGKLKSEGLRTEFKLDSTWVFYTEKGDTLNIINYRYGKKNGYHYTYTSFDDSIHHNIVESKELYLDDKKQGISYYYFKDGALEKEIPFKNDWKNGTGYQYNNKGEIVAILQYKNNSLIDKQIINRIDGDGKKQGVWRTFYADHKVKTECYYKDDLLNGYSREFDEKGKEIKIERYINGVLQEENKNALATTKESVEVKNTYYAGGGLKSSGGYKNNRPVGVHRTYNEKGKINGSSTYNDEGKKIADGIVDGRGREQGNWTLYDSLGHVSGKGVYKAGNREGEWQFFHPNGQIEQKGVYKNGKPEGEWIWYYDNGKVHRTENFYQGEEDGEFAEFDIGGDTIARGTYSEGFKTGLWKIASGDVVIYEKYSDDVLHGEYRILYRDTNKKKLECAYLQGNLHGKYTDYYPDGRILSQGTYMSGNKDGLWRYYSEDGLLESEIEYSQGEIIKADGASMPKK